MLAVNVVKLFDIYEVISPTVKNITVLSGVARIINNVCKVNHTKLGLG